jgi:hypothetical protein
MWMFVSMRGLMAGFDGQWHSEQVAVWVEAGSVDVDENRIADRDWHGFTPFGTKHVA